MQNGNTVVVEGFKIHGSSPVPGIDVFVANGKSPRGAGFFLFSLYKFRIPNPDEFTARFWALFWRGSHCVSMVVTLVRARRA
jgi:hypothetical protein